MFGIHTHTHSDMGLPKGKRYFALNFALNPLSIKNGEMTCHIVLLGDGAGRAPLPVGT